MATNESGYSLQSHVDIADGNQPQVPQPVHGFISGTMEDEAFPRTLYIGNLDPRMSEEFIHALFTHMGEVKTCKVNKYVTGDPYAFIEFWEHSTAASALSAMDKRICFGKEMKVTWALGSSVSKPDFSQQFYVFVGDLSATVDTGTLREAFSKFGEISDCRVIRDPHTLRPRGYGFVAFTKKSEAETAINMMNGYWLGNRSIVTNWAARKTFASSLAGANHNQLSYKEVFDQSSPANRTVYCSRIHTGLTNDLVKTVFSQFGEIEDIRKFQEKGYVFVKFSTKEAATNAIITVHNTNVNGYTVKCSWGREKPPPSEQLDFNFNVVPAQQYLYGPQQQLGYYGYSQPMGSSFQSVPLLQNPYYPSNFGYQPAQYLANYGGLQQGWDWNARLVSADYNGAVTAVPETTSQQMNWKSAAAAVAGRPETPEIPTHKI